jgi:hypothetical protein
VKNGLTEENIEMELRELSNRFELRSSIVKQEIKLSLENLSKLGFIDWDSNGVIKLTAKGYILMI